MDRVFDVLQSNQDRDYMYVRYNNTKYDLIDMNDVHNYVTSNRDKYQIDEVLYGNGVYRLVMDIETRKNDKTTIIDIEKIKLELYNRLVKIIPKINTSGILLKVYYIQDSTKLQKYRLYTNVSCTVQVMKYIAKNMSAEARKFIDIGIYKESHCLRLPFSYKLECNILNKRTYNVPKLKQYLEYTMSYIDNTIYIPTPIVFDIKQFYKVNKLTDSNDYGTDLGISTNGIKTILSKYYSKSIINSLEFTQKPNSIIVNFNKIKHTCIYNPTIKDHDSNIVIYRKLHADGEFYLYKLHATCLAHRCREDVNNNIIIHEFERFTNIVNVDKDVDVIKNAMERMDLDINDIPFTHNQKYLTKNNESDNFETIEFNEYYRNKNTFIISNMGSGKSNLMEHYFNTNFKNKNILYISFRKSLTNNLAQRLDLCNYQDHKTMWFGDDFRKIICQIESLDKIKNLQATDLIVIDEISSILTHSMDRELCLQNFIKLMKLKNVTKIFMDAYINESILKLVHHLDGLESNIIHNEYRLKENETIIIKPSNKSADSKLKVLKTIVYYAKQGLKLVCPISNKSLLYEIHEQLIKLDISAAYITGDNLKLDDNGKLHSQNKYELFGNVNERFRQYQVILYTSTMSSGVSFDLKYFDMCISLYNPNSIQPDLFIQSLCRVRNFNLNKHIMFLYEKRESKKADENIEIYQQLKNDYKLSDLNSLLCNESQQLDYVLNI